MTVPTLSSPRITHLNPANRLSAPYHHCSRTAHPSAFGSRDQSGTISAQDPNQLTLNNRQSLALMRLLAMPEEGLEPPTRGL
jgi:hypothetical protein